MFGWDCQTFFHPKNGTWEGNVTPKSPVFLWFLDMGSISRGPNNPSETHLFLAFGGHHTSIGGRGMGKVGGKQILIVAVYAKPTLQKSTALFVDRAVELLRFTSS